MHNKQHKFSIIKFLCNKLYQEGCTKKGSTHAPASARRAPSAARRVPGAARRAPGTARRDPGAEEFVMLRKVCVCDGCEGKEV